jgi:RNA polymerase sigma-70 factor (ECF subfamily)
MIDDLHGPSSPEEKLVARAQHGDSRAMGEIYQRYVDRVYSFIEFRVRDTALAEDLTQEVFLQVLRGIHGLDWQGTLGPWILRIARNAVVDHWRRMGRRPEGSLVGSTDPGEHAESVLDRVPAAGVAAELEAAEAALDRGHIMAATAKLTELQQQVVGLRFSAGLSIRETAQVMNRSEGAVKNLQHHALRALRRELGGAIEERE